MSPSVISCRPYSTWKLFVGGVMSGFCPSCCFVFSCHHLHLSLPVLLFVVRTEQTLASSKKRLTTILQLVKRYCLSIRGHCHNNFILFVIVLRCRWCFISFISELRRSMSECVCHTIYVVCPITVAKYLFWLLEGHRLFLVGRTYIFSETMLRKRICAKHLQNKHG